jgi:pterin-4a-carbinolamine dehydratase
MRIDPVGHDGPGVAVEWTTHSLGGVTDLDVLMAETTERLAKG